MRCSTCRWWDWHGGKKVTPASLGDCRWGPRHGRYTAVVLGALMLGAVKETQARDTCEHYNKPPEDRHGRPA